MNENTQDLIRVTFAITPEERNRLKSILYARGETITDWIKAGMYELFEEDKRESR